MATVNLRELASNLRQASELEIQAAEALERVIRAREAAEIASSFPESFPTVVPNDPESTAAVSPAVAAGIQPTGAELFGKYRHFGKPGASPQGRYSPEGYERQVRARRLRAKNERAAKRADKKTKLHTLAPRKAA